MASINFFHKLNKQFNGYTLQAFNKSRLLINVSPGPGQLPQRVIKSIGNELNGTTNNFQYGNTPLEMSHRSPEFKNMLKSVNNSVRKFMKIPDNYEILWTPGGGHGQFSSIPLNMRNLVKNKKVYYAVNGTWSNRAYQESKQFINSENIFKESYSSKLNVLEYNTIPKISKNMCKDESYLYLCSNETVNGIEYNEGSHSYPTRDITNNSKLIVDMSSDFLMKKVNWEKIDVAFASSSKNMGTSGTNIVIIKKSILDELKHIHIKQEIPGILNWQNYYETKSLYNTIPVFNIYLLDKIMNYYNGFGDIDYFHNETLKKGKVVYSFLDKSVLFKSVVKDTNIRSNINIPFIVNNGCIETRNKFLHFCCLNNVVGLRTKTPFSYKSLNLLEPLRLNLYNGVTYEQTKSIINHMNKFEQLYFT